MPFKHKKNLSIYILPMLLGIHSQIKAATTYKPSDDGNSSTDTSISSDDRASKPEKPTKFDSFLQESTTFTGNQAYMAIRGNNYYTSSSDYIITFSLNHKTGALTNQQQTFADSYTTPTPAPFNFALILQGTLPANITTQSIAQISWVVVNDTAYLATRGYIKNLGVYIALYTLDTTADSTSGQLINKQSITIPQTEPITDMQWVVVNDTAYLATWGFDSQYSQYFIAVYTLDQSSGSLLNKQKFLLPQAQSINQLTWTVVNNEAYLAVWGLNISTNLYFISLYTLDQTNGNLTNQQITTMAQSESITQIQWTTLNNNAYIGVNGYNISSSRPFITIFTLNQTTGQLINKQKTLLLQQETCNQIEWVIVNNKAYLGIWGFDSLANNSYLSTFILNTTTGAIVTRKKVFTIFGEMISYITWVVVDNTAFLAAPGLDNFQNKAFISLYTLNENTIRLINLQITFLPIQRSINQIEWVVSNNTAYLGARGYDNLQSRFYMSVFTLSTSIGNLSNDQIRFSTSGETFYQFEWVAV